MTTQDLKNTCIICASDWEDFHEQLRAACEARGISTLVDRRWKDVVTITPVKCNPLEVKVLFKHVDTSCGV